MTTTISRDRVLIVEDDPTTRLGLTELVRTWGFSTEGAADGQEALQRITAFRPSIIISDLVMPRMGGLELLHSVKEEGGDVTIVILTAQGTVETAVEAIKEGAYDYLTKPIEPQRLKILLDKIVERQETIREVKVLRRQLRDSGSFGRMIGASPQMRKVYQIIEQAAPTAASVLIWGESGTGKELVAQTVHQLSPRVQAPFVPINCAAIPETLLESEIFGHERGAFTGALDRREGCFELADRGTLFLDEVAEMTPATQVKLLRVLQERTFRRLGGRTEQTVDVRVIAATNSTPLEAVKNGRLREDLYYRLNVFAVELPPLRQRKDDLPLLIQAFLDRIQRAQQQIGVGGRSGGHARTRAIQLARQRPRASQRYRARGDSQRWRVHRAEASAAAREPLTSRDFGARHLARAGCDGGRSRAASDSAHARAHARQQDARGRNSGYQPENVAQQAQSAAGKKLGEARGSWSVVGQAQA